MKPLVPILCLVVGLVCAGQQTGSASAQGPCSIANTGKNNIFVLTCSGVDRKLADQIRQLVAVSKRDGSTLSDISVKLGALLVAFQSPSSTTIVTSINQLGGVTAGTVNINGSTGIVVESKVVSIGQRKNMDNGTFYLSTYSVKLSGQVPQFYAIPSGESVVEIDMHPGGGGISMDTGGKLTNGSLYHTLQNAYGENTVLVTSSSPAPPKVQYYCEGAVCVAPPQTRR